MQEKIKYVFIKFLVLFIIKIRSPEMGESYKTAMTARLVHMHAHRYTWYFPLLSMLIMCLINAFLNYAITARNLTVTREVPEVTLI